MPPNTPHAPKQTIIPPNRHRILTPYRTCPKHPKSTHNTGGFFVNAGSVPKYYAWIKYISLFNYLNGAIQKNEFQGLVFENGLTGEDVLESLHLMPLSVWQNLSVILGMVVGFRLLAFVFVRRNFAPQPFALPPDAVKGLAVGVEGGEGKPGVAAAGGVAEQGQGQGEDGGLSAV